ncbi:MAG: hypothetical protein AAF721_02925 [Myxococcota bacterium]
MVLAVRLVWAGCLVMAPVSIGGCADDSEGMEVSGESDTDFAGTQTGSSVDDGAADEGSDSGLPPGTSDGDEPGACVDSDGDGFAAAACGGTDCDDASFWIHPDAADGGWGVTSLIEGDGADAGVALTRTADGRLFTLVTGAQPDVVDLRVVDGIKWTSYSVSADAPRDPSIFTGPDDRVYAAFVSNDTIFYAVFENDRWDFAAAPTTGPVVGTTITWNEILSTGDYPGAGTVYYGVPDVGLGSAGNHGGTWAAGVIDQWYTRGVNPDAYWWHGGSAQQRVISHGEDGQLLEAYYAGFGGQGDTVAEDAGEYSAIAGTGPSQYWIAYADLAGSVQVRRGSFAAFNPVMGPDGAPTAAGPLDLYVAPEGGGPLHAAFGGPTLRYGAQLGSPESELVAFDVQEVDASPVTDLALTAAPGETRIVDILYTTNGDVRLASHRPADGVDNDCDGVSQ